MEKQGYKTTEFWLTIIMSIFTWLNMSGILGAFTIPIESLEPLITLVITYILGRSGLKVASPAVKAYTDAKARNKPTT